MVNGDESFKRPGAVPFTWEIRPGVPKTRNHQTDHDPTLLQPPKKLPPLRLKPLPPSPSSSSSLSSFSKTRPASPFDPPSSFKLKPSPDSTSHSSRPPSPYFRSSSPRAGLNFGDALPKCFPKSLFGLTKSKSGFFKKTGEESSSSESDNFYESETTFTPSEDSSQRSVSSSTRWSSPKSSFSSSSRRGSPLRRNKSDLSSYEKKTILMMARSRLG